MNIEILSDGLPRILPPYEDGIFKALFTWEGSKPALEDALSSFISSPVQGAVIRNPEPPIMDTKIKRQRYDIRCTFNDGKGRAAAEMQARCMDGDNQGNDFARQKIRAAYELCYLHSLQDGRGVDYAEFARSYQITICNFSAFRDAHGLVETFTLKNQEGRELTDAIAAVFVDLSLVPQIAKKPIREMSGAEMWSVFLAKGNDPDYQELIDQIISKKEAIHLADQLLRNISTTEEERAQFISRRILEQDIESDRALAQRRMREAHEKGLEKGRKEERAQIIALMVKQGISPDFIEQARNLPI
jgi:predicted transposase/invertase (TIGR01784 family)